MALAYIIGDYSREDLLAGMLEYEKLAERPANGGGFTYKRNLMALTSDRRILIKRNTTDFSLHVDPYSDYPRGAKYSTGKQIPPQAVVIVCFEEDGPGSEFNRFCNTIKQIENSRLLFVRMADFKDTEQDKNFYENTEGFYKLARDCNAPYIEVNYPELVNMDKLLDATSTLISNQGKKTKEQILRECLEAAIEKSVASQGSLKFGFFSVLHTINKELTATLENLNNESEPDEIIARIKRKTDELSQKKDNKYTRIYSDLVADYENRKENALEDIAQETRLRPPLVKNARNLVLL